MMRVFMAILCSLWTVCSVSAQSNRQEGADRQAAIYHHDETAGGRTVKERLAEVHQHVPKFWT